MFFLWQQAAWVLKCKAVTKQSYIDDIELDEEGLAEVLLDEHATAAVPRCGMTLKPVGGSVFFDHH